MPLITDRHLEQYREEGYCLIEGLIPLELIDAARQRTLEIATQPPTWPATHFQVADPERYRSDQGGTLPIGIQRPASQERVFADVADHAHLVAAMAALLQSDVERFTDQLGLKHAAITEEQGGRSYFHQDSYYWKIDPELGCNCWIPLTDVGVNASALAVMPRSQAGWQLVEHESYYDDPPMGSVGDDGFQPFKRHRVTQSQVDFSQEQLIATKPGDGLFFTNYTWHRSEANTSCKTQVFYAIAYQRRNE
jgi:ectoine hydroxylase-related dioxygenase (phytanoyl-CoA dioxygenase family)